MAIAPYFVISPSAILSLLGILRGEGKVPKHEAPDWREKTVHVIIPAHNEERSIALCLASLFRQTLQPDTVILIDDNSTDRTVEVAHAFCEANGVPIRIIQRSQRCGKAEGIQKEAKELKCDVEFVLDADTILESENYLERLVEELYRTPGVASACGSIHPLRNFDREKMAAVAPMDRFRKLRPDLPYLQPQRGLHAFLQKITNVYRDVLYYFVQNIIYRGDQMMFGSIPNPVGCAVAYRREYLDETISDVLLDHNGNLTTSEDIFFGLSFINHGYRNIQVRDVVVRSQEPEAQIVPRQYFLWSSSWLQSAYYLPRLFWSPIIMLTRLFRSNQPEPAAEDAQQITNGRSHWPEGQSYTHKSGRAIGWVLSLFLLEKISFPIILLLMVFFGWWNALAVTVAGEMLVFSILVALCGPAQKAAYFLKGIVSAPLRYGSLFIDLFVLSRFAYDITIGGRSKWRK